MTPPTYADALAACREQWGEPDAARARRSIHLRAEAWPTHDGAGAVTLYESGGGAVWVEAAHADDLRATEWMLNADAPLTPLPDAIAAAGRWLAARGATTAAKGP